MKISDISDIGDVRHDIDDDRYIADILVLNQYIVEILVAGGSFSYLRVELGDFVPAGNILLEYVVSGAGISM